MHCKTPALLGLLLVTLVAPLIAAPQTLPAPASSESPEALLDQALEFAYGLETATAMLWLYRAEAGGDRESAAAARDTLGPQLSARAAFRVGQVLVRGAPDLEASPGEAIRWLRLAHEGGESRACFPLAELLLDGPVALRAPEEAVRLLEEAASRQEGRAFSRLARCLREGIGATPDPRRAAHFESLAAEAGDPEGQYLRGKALLEEGQEEQAWEWLERAALQGHPDATGMTVGHRRQEQIRRRKELSRGTPGPLASLVLYWRPRCPACGVFDPLIQEVAKQQGIPLRRVNIWEPEGSLEAKVEAVRAVPLTYLLDAEGRVLQRLSGARSREDLVEILEGHQEE